MRHHRRNIDAPRASNRVAEKKRRSENRHRKKGEGRTSEKWEKREQKNRVDPTREDDSSIRISMVGRQKKQRPEKKGEVSN